MAQKLIDRKDILNDIITNIVPLYYPDAAIDQSRTSIFGVLTEADAKAIEDTVTLEQRRAADYCPELSQNAIHVRETAKIRGVGVNYATPSRTFALLSVLRSDVLEKGVKVNNEIQFTIDRRSTLVHDNVTFSLEDNIIIRAVKRASGWVFSANYGGEHASYDSYIRMYEGENEYSQDMVTMIVQVLQCNYNIQEKVVTDDVEFLYDGISFDYSNRLADFDIYVKKSATQDYIKLDKEHYLYDGTTNAIYYNDNDDNILYILNNPALNIGVNATIRVEIKETLGTDGDITVGSSGTTFSLYRDVIYNYSGVNVNATMLTDAGGSNDGDTLADIKARLIDAKTRRDNITTEHDIVSYINDIDANVQIVKKRNDIEDRRYYMYTLLRYNREIAPANTMPLRLTGIRSRLDIGDFDHYDYTVNRKVLRAYNKFQYLYDSVEEQYFAVKVPRDTNEEGAYYFTCPFMILINDLEIASYYFTSIDRTIALSGKSSNNVFPFQLICQGIHIYRNAHDVDTHNQYTFTISGTMNTSNDSDLVDQEGEIIDKEKIMCYILFKREGTAVAYLPMAIDSYNRNSREFTFTGSMTTNDYITATDGLEITTGLKRLGVENNYGSTIDYKDGSMEVYFMYKYDDPAEDYPNTDVIYQYLPTSRTEGYELMCAYYNNPQNLYNLILEYSKFTSSPVTVVPAGQTIVDYVVGEVPFIEYEYGVTNIINMFDTFENMAETYGSLLKLTTDFDVSLKFIATYGHSRYIEIRGGRDENGEEITIRLNNLNPIFYFKIYANNVDVDDIRNFIYEYLRDTYITDSTVFMSNICTLVEQTYPNVRSIKYMGVDKFDASYQEFVYLPPEFTSVDVITKFVPEQLNTIDIQIELDEN